MLMGFSLIEYQNDQLSLLPSPRSCIFWTDCNCLYNLDMVQARKSEMNAKTLEHINFEPILLKYVMLHWKRKHNRR